MIFGFALNSNGSSKFGVVSANSEAEAKRDVIDDTGAAEKDVNIIDAGEALSQHNGVAFLVPAEL